MPVFIRVDDFPTAKPDERDRHNMGTFMLFHRVMREELGGKSYLLGVIPSMTSDDDLRRLGDADGIVVGMHGVDHDERFQNEFRDHLTQLEVENLLRINRRRLQALAGQPVDVYLPPHNVVDGRTLFACCAIGFRAFTVGPETAKHFQGPDELVSRDGGKSRIRPLHSFSPLGYGRSDELLERGSVEWLRERCTRTHQSTYLALHWTWESNIGLDNLRTYLRAIAPMVEDFSF